jgi:hypothetical protein
VEIAKTDIGTTRTALGSSLGEDVGFRDDDDDDDNFVVFSDKIDVSGLR